MADNKANIDILINTANSAKSVRELRGALKELVSAQQDVDKSSPDFQKLVDGINETEGKIGDLNDSFKSFAGSGMERLTSSTYLLKDGLSNMDLDKVKIAFDGLKQLPKALSGEFDKLTGVIKKLDFKSLGSSMKTLGESGVGALTKSIVQLGKAILTNPILLLAAVIIGLVAVVVKFYDKIIPLRLAIEAFGAAVDVVIQALKDFADWIGITDFAASEAADNQIKNAKKTEDAMVRKYDQEIAMAEAAGLSTLDIEKKKLLAVQRSNADQIAAIQKKMSVEGDADGKQKEALTEHVRLIEDAYNKGLVLDAKNNKRISDEQAKADADTKAKYKTALDDRIKIRQEFNQVMDDMSIKLIKNDMDRETASNLKSYTMDLEKYAKTYKVDENGRSKSSEFQIKWDAYKLKREALYQAEDMKIREKYQTKNVEAQAAYVDTLLKLGDLLNKKPGKDGYLDLKAEAEFVKEQFKLNQERLSSTIKLLEIESNTKKNSYEGDKAMLLKIDKETKAKISVATEEAATKDAEASKASIDKVNKDLIAQKELSVMLTKEGSMEELKAKKDALALKAVIDLEDTNATVNEKLVIEQKYKDDLKQLDKDYLDSVDNSNKLLLDKEREKVAKQLTLYAQYIDTVKGALNSIGDIASMKMKQEGDEYNATEQRKIEDMKYTNDVRIQTLEDEAAAGTITAEQLAQKKKEIQDAEATSEYETKLAIYNFNKELKSKEFKRNKAFQLGSAVMDTASGIMKSLAASPLAYGPIPNPVGIASMIAVAVAGAANIAKILATKEGDSGAPPKPPVLSSAGAGSGSGNSSSSSSNSFSAPQFYKLGQGGGSGERMSQRIYVLESDITNTQKNISQVEVRATTTLR